MTDRKPEPKRKPAGFDQWIEELRRTLPDLTDARILKRKTNKTNCGEKQ